MSGIRNWQYRDLIMFSGKYHQIELSVECDECYVKRPYIPQRHDSLI